MALPCIIRGACFIINKHRVFSLLDASLIVHSVWSVRPRRRNCTGNRSVFVFFCFFFDSVHYTMQDTFKCLISVSAPAQVRVKWPSGVIFKKEHSVLYRILAVKQIRVMLSVFCRDCADVFKSINTFRLYSRQQTYFVCECLKGLTLIV